MARFDRHFLNCCSSHAIVMQIPPVAIILQQEAILNIHFQTQFNRRHPLEF